MITQTGSEFPRGIGTTRAQLQNAEQGAIFIACNRTSYAQDLARSLNRFDLIIMAEDALDHPERFMGLPFGKQIIIDHAICLVCKRVVDDGMGSVTVMSPRQALLHNLAFRQRIVQAKDLPQAVLEELQNKRTNALATKPQASATPTPVLIAEPTPWRLSGCGITLRDAKHRRVGTIALRDVRIYDFNKTMKASALELQKRICDAINQPGSQTADALIQHDAAATAAPIPRERLEAMASAIDQAQDKPPTQS